MSNDGGGLDPNVKGATQIQRPLGAADPIEQDALARLCSPPPRWGYERVEPPPPALSRERQSLPTRKQVRKIARTRASGLWEATALAVIGGVLAIVLDANFGLFAGGTHQAETGGVVVTHSIAAAIAFFAARAWYRSPQENAVLTALPAQAGRRWVAPLLNGGCAFLVPYLVLPVEAIRGWRRILRDSGALVAHPREALGWTAALTTLGASLLGAGARLTVCDLSRRLTIDVLAGLADAAGVAGSETVLPASFADCELLDDMSWPELATVLVEALHSSQHDPDVSRRERQSDRSVIRDVAECLDSSGPVSIARLRSALLVVQGAPNGIAPIGPDERERLSVLFNEVQRTHGDVFERVIRIERALRDVELLEATSPAGAAKLRTADRGDLDAAGGPRLQVIGVDKHAEDLENHFLVDLLFQLLARRVRSGTASADTGSARSRPHSP